MEIRPDALRQEAMKTLRSKMEIRPDALRQEAMKTLGGINRQIEETKKVAEEMRINPWELRTSSGDWVMIPLLHSKAECLHTIALLQRGAQLSQMQERGTSR